MEILGKRLPSAETVSRGLMNLGRPEREKQPLIAVFNVTLDCNDNGNQQQSFGKPKSQLDQQMEVLRTIRSDVPNIYFTGGDGEEPTTSPNFKQLLRKSFLIRFDTIGVNTNGVLYCPEILEYANLLVINLPSTDPEKIAATCHIAPKCAEQILENIKKYVEQREPEATQIVINCVVTGDNIPDVYKIAEFCRRLGINLNITPAISDKGSPDKRLVGNPSYLYLINWLKRQNGLMACSQAYLDTIRGFKPFVCTPQVVPNIQPNGDIITPCPNFPAEKETVNIIKAEGVNKALREGREQYEKAHGIVDTQTKCSHLCHTTCNIEAAGISTITGLIHRLKKEALSKIS